MLGLAATLFLLSTAAFAAAPEEPSDSSSGTALAESTRITIIPDSLIDSVGTFTRNTVELPKVALDPKELKDRVSTLRRRVQFNRHDVGACVELADLLGPSRDIESRREAAEALRQALRT
ncbi:MAG TPA: hypothetical protein VFP10_05930, partial [Candidatus Eisenbacteria bacterium]|nr:hypothetical protein [Candidatus Eisenbacteria bacterium]